MKSLSSIDLQIHNSGRMIIFLDLLLFGEIVVFIISSDEREESDVPLIPLLLLLPTPPNPLLLPFCLGQLYLFYLLVHSSTYVLASLSRTDKLIDLLNRPLHQKDEKFPYQDAVSILSSKSCPSPSTLHSSFPIFQGFKNSLALDSHLLLALLRCKSLTMSANSLTEHNNISTSPVLVRGAVLYAKLDYVDDSSDGISIDQRSHFFDILSISQDVVSSGGVVDMVNLHAILAHWTNPMFNTSSYQDKGNAISESVSEEKYAADAVICALNLHKVWGDRLCIGVHYGIFYLGQVGCARCAFSTVLGPTINSTCRLCYLCDEIHCKLCLSSVLVGVASHHEDLQYSYVGRAALAGVEDCIGVYTIKKYC